MRASVSTGFRAPGVQQKFYSSVSTNLNAAGVLTETLTAREGSAVTRAFGIAPLKEETSKSASIGVVLRPITNFSLTADVYRTKIDDRIVFSSKIAPESGACATRRMPDPRTSSIRCAWARRSSSPMRSTRRPRASTWWRSTPPRPSGSTLVLSGQLGFNKTEVKARIRTSPVLTGAQLFDDAQVTLIERGQPRKHHVVAADYTAGPWNVNARANYYGEVQGQGFTAPFVQTWEAKWMVDLTRPLHVQQEPEPVGGDQQPVRHLPDQMGPGPRRPLPATGLHLLLGNLPVRDERPHGIRQG